MEPRIKYAKTSDGVNIAYAVFGDGPAIVVSSTIWGNIHSYRHIGNPWYDRLVSLGWTIITYDNRGVGASDRNVEDYSLEARLRDLDAVVEQVAPDQFPLCGFWQGSVTAIAHAARHPARVSHLILCNGFARSREVYAQIPAMRLSQQTLEMAEDEWEFHMETLAHAVGGYSDTGRAHNLVNMFRTGMNPSDYLAYRRAAYGIDVTEEVAQVRASSLVVVDSTQWSAAAAPLSRSLAAQIPNARYAETADLGGAMDEFLREGGLVPSPSRVSPAEPGREASDVRTILFTDLVGHTEMMQRLGDEKGRDVLRQHERITREVLKAHGGTEVKTMGDGFLASFGSVTKAVECAIALQKGFAVWNASTAHPEALEGRAEPRRPVEPLHVRVGLNAGEPIEEEGDLFGSAVILASRIASAAKGGEILAADVVHGLCSGKPFAFSDRGEQALRGFENPVRLFEVSWR